MKIRTLVALMLAPPLAWAQPGAAGADPANPDAPVPRTVYRSVFVDTPTGVEADTLDWKKANQEVGQFRRGHIDLLRWEEQQEAARGGQRQQPNQQPHQHHGGSRP